MPGHMQGISAYAGNTTRQRIKPMQRTPQRPRPCSMIPAYGMAAACMRAQQLPR